jgi:hypothetical protein
LVHAEAMKDTNVRPKMGAIAATYENLAQRLEQRTADVDKA